MQLTGNIKEMIGQESELDKWIKKIRLMLENPLEDPIEFLDEFKMNLFSSEIMVFTPKGILVSLPKGASALDFAYEIHTEIGNKAIGAKINYKLNPINCNSDERRPGRDNHFRYCKT